ncbi:hypothetical protein JG688_00010658 [Phytophthora aleatoria]|uniref:Uncharacterized protein n=1 Tax=Phytophthora aleatoria TaxID=2496075 RepID=A0A8J5MFD7_9STRA|nr:hypothetical protein JG688_00010658 [Phytophthora aleatoria]
MPTQPHRLSHLLNPLQCTEQDNTMLIELAETLVVHNIEQFSALELGKNGAPANKNRWKEVKKKEGTKIFMEKATKGEPLEMPSLMLLGTVVGKLEDFMYAVVAPSTEVMGVKSAIIQDGIVDCKVLHEVVTPTMDDPFNLISSTASTVQMYVRGFFDLNDDKNELGNRATMNGIASHWMSYSRKVECAQVKKLLWTMHKNDNRESILSLKDDGKLSVVCSRCSVTKTVTMLAPNRVSVMEKKRIFCVQCITDVTNTDALRITREEILNGGKQVAAYY